MDFEHYAHSVKAYFQQFLPPSPAKPRLDILVQQKYRIPAMTELYSVIMIERYCDLLKKKSSCPFSLLLRIVGLYF